MNRTLMTVFLSLILGFFLIYPSAYSRTLEEIKTSGYINVGAGASKNEKPVSFKHNGRLVGIDVELIDLISKSLDVDVKRIEHNNLDDRINFLENGSADIVVSSFSITKEREEKIDFSKAYLTTGIGVVMRKEFQDKIKLFSELSKVKVKIGVKKGSTALTEFKEKFPNISIIPLLKEELETKLFEGDIDGYANDKLLLAPLVNENKNKYFLLKGHLAPDRYGIGIQKGNKSLLDEINKIIIENKKNKKIDEITNKYKQVLKNIRSFQEIKKSGYIVVGATASNNKKPVSFMMNGKKVGIDVELIDLIARSMGVEVKRKEHINLKDRETVLEDVSVDMVVSSFSITKKRKEKIDFSRAYLTTAIGVVMQKKFENEIITFDDLTNKKIGVKKDSTAQLKFEKNYPNISIVPLSKKEIESELSSGNLDGYANDTLLISSLVKKNPNKYYLLNRVLAPDPYGIGVTKGNKSLLEEINKIIIKNRKNIKDIVEKYGKALPEKSVSSPREVKSIPSSKQVKSAPCLEEYTVKNGDTLAEIARIKLGDDTRWSEIYTKNESVISDANFIRVGQKLTILLDRLCDISSSSEESTHLPLQKKLKKINRLASELKQLTGSLLETPK